MTLSFSVPYWYDLHTHLRQEELLEPIIQSQLDMGCAGVLAMPNTKPPTAKVLDQDALNYWSVESYVHMIRAAGGDQFDDIIVPLYLTKDTTPKMIEEGAKSRILRACKYYPPHGTTGADFGFPIHNFIDNGVFEAMQAHGVVLCIHGEEHGLECENYFDRNQNAEELFYQNQMPLVREKFPSLRIACEHITTKRAVDFVQESGDNIHASVTPQHILYTIGHLLKGLNYHLYCLPLVKFEEDRQAIRKAVTDLGNTKFYAGTDSAAHTIKATACGCAAGCFTGGIAPQLYVQGFEEHGLDMSCVKNQKAFENFLCNIGADFYGLKKPSKMMTLSKVEYEVSMLKTGAGDITPLPIGLQQKTIPWTLSI